MTGRRVWIRPGGHVLAHQPDGWPLPADYAEKVHQITGRRWLWDRDDVWPCHATKVCKQLAVWRTTDSHTRGFYCNTHLPHARPREDPSPVCPTCGGPVDPALADLGRHFLCKQ